MTPMTHWWLRSESNNCMKCSQLSLSCTWSPCTVLIHLLRLITLSQMTKITIFVHFLTILPPGIIQMTPWCRGENPKTYGNVCNGPYLVYKVHWWCFNIDWGSFLWCFSCDRRCRKCQYLAIFGCFALNLPRAGNWVSQQFQKNYQAIWVSLYIILIISGLICRPLRDVYGGAVRSWTKHIVMQHIVQSGIMLSLAISYAYFWWLNQFIVSSFDTVGIHEMAILQGVKKTPGMTTVMMKLESFPIIT